MGGVDHLVYTAQDPERARESFSIRGWGPLAASSAQAL